jgi:hypothetical protein
MTYSRCMRVGYNNQHIALDCGELAGLLTSSVEI